MLVLEGPDQVGKTQIAKELSLRLGIGYYKNSQEWTSDLKGSDGYFLNLLRYGAAFLTDLLAQTKPGVVLDRFYPSEWVYSKVLGRQSDEKVIRSIDEKFAQAGGRIVVCRRRNYNGIVDDLHPFIDELMLKSLDGAYATFTSWTQCPTITLWVDDEDLEREVRTVIEWLDAFDGH